MGNVPTMIPMQVRARVDVEAEIARRLAAERARLERDAGIRTRSVDHFKRPVELPFTADQRDRVTILIGGLTWKHDTLVRAALQSAGYRVEVMPTPDVPAFQLGKEYGNNGQCNPTYFMVGHLIQFLQNLERQGMSRPDIIDRYVFFTAGSCGPCRFGMYEAEYRLAVQNAGFDGFRILLFQQTDGVKSAVGEPGLKFTVDFGMGALNALNYGDVLNDVTYQIRPFEARPGETDRVVDECMEYLTSRMRDREMYDLKKSTSFIGTRMAGQPKIEGIFNTLGKVRDHLYGRQSEETLRHLRERLATIEVDRLRVKPIVKVTGEFWAQTTEGDGNFRMFSFLEREGAEVIVEPIGTWAMYMLWLAQASHAAKKGLNRSGQARTLRRVLKEDLAHRLKQTSFDMGRRFYTHQYRRVVRALGDIAH